MSGIVGNEQSNGVFPQSTNRYTDSFLKIQKSPLLRTGSTLTLFVVFLLLALMIVPGVMGVGGHVLGAPLCLQQIANVLTLPGVIAITTIGGLASITLFIWSAIVLAKNCLSVKRQSIPIIENLEDIPTQHYKIYENSFGHICVGYKQEGTNRIRIASIVGLDNDYISANTPEAAQHWVKSNLQDYTGM